MVDEKGKKYVRGKMYEFFPVRIYLDDLDGCDSDEDLWQWKYFTWVFDFMNLIMGLLLGDNNAFPIKLNKGDIKKLSKEEYEKLFI